MADSRHNKYVSVTDWFKPAPGSTTSGTVSGSTGAATSGASFVGGSWGSGGGGGGLTITIIKTNDTTPESNSNVYSALRVHNSFIAKDKDERTEGKLSSDAGFEVGEFVSGASGAICYIDPETLQTTAELDRLKVRIKAYFETLEIINVNSVGGKQIISPAGSINCIRVDEYGGTIDILKERQATDEEGNPLYDINGNPIMETYIESVDNGVPEDTYRCYFLAELDGETIENRFHVGDQAYSQMFDAQPGISSNVSSKYYWRLVTGISYDPIEIAGKKYHYIDLSVSDCDTDSDAPSVGDIICHRGHRTLPGDIEGRDRQNALEFSAVDTFSPSITLYQGIGESDPDNGKYPYSLVGKDIIQYGVNRLNNRAFMNVYGDMYVGDRDGQSYLQFDETAGLTVKGNIQFGSKSKMDGDDLTLEERIELASKAYEEDVNQFKAAVEKSFLDVLNQIDGAIETYFLDPEPTLENKPAVDWDTDSIKASHVGDLYYSKQGNAYRFQYDEITNEDGSKYNRYYWNLINDTNVTLALANAQKAQDTADSKRKIFVRQPSTNDSYEEGDMWANATYPATGVPKYSNDLLRAVTSKQAGEPFSIDHWVLSSKYTDDTAAIAAQEAADEAQRVANNAQSDATAAANRLSSWAADNVISPTEKQGIKEEYVRVIKDKDSIHEQWDQYFLDTTDSTEIGKIYIAYNNAYLPYVEQLIYLFTAKDSDGVVLENIPIPDDFDDNQTAYYSNRAIALNTIAAAAKKVADDAQAAANNAYEEAEKALTAAEEAKTSVYGLNTTVTGLKDFTDDAFLDGIINSSERKTIENYIYQINTVLAQVQQSYSEVVDNTFLVESVAKTNLENSYNSFITATNELLQTVNVISSQGSVENIDRAGFEVKYNNFNSKYSDYTKYLNAAIKFIEYAINSRVDTTLQELGGYSYLKNAFNEETTVTGGLVLTSLVALGYTDDNQQYHVMGGINGSHANNDGIAIWAGGSAVDRAIEPNNPNAADFLVRMDGTGYAAGGNFWWESDGTIHADPLSFVISENSVGALLSSLKVYYNVTDSKPSPYALEPLVPFTKLTIASDIELNSNARIALGDVYIAYDPENKAIYFADSKGGVVNFYTTGGISMFGQGNISVNSIMDAISLNLDPNTLTIQNGVLTVIGGTGGGEGINEEQLENYLTTNNYAKKSDIPSLSGYQPLITSSNKLAYSLISGTPTLLSSFTNDIGFITSSALNDYLPLSGGTLTNHLSLGTSDTTANLEYRVHRSGVRGSVGISIDQTYLLNKNTDGIVRLITVGYNGLRFRDGSNEYTVYHSGNFTPSDYLPKTGGIISGSLIIDGSSKTDNLISLKSKFVDNDGACRIQYTDSNGEHQGYVMSGWGNLVMSHRSYNQIGVGDSGIWCSTNNGTTKNAIWHEGNDGSGSGLNADLLDGWELNSIVNTDNSADFGSTSSVPSSFITGYTNTAANTNTPYTYILGNQCTVINVNRKGTDYGAQYAFGFGSRRIAVRRKNGSNTWTKWDGIIAAEADSASKLQTARTIWGQSFDGSGNVSGKLTGVTQIQNDENKGIYLWSNTYSNNLPTNSGNLGTGVGIGLNPEFGTFIWGKGDGNGHIQVGRSDGTNTSYNLLLQEFGGKVGIGTTDPKYKLDVNGAIYTNNNIYASAIELSMSTPFIDFHFNNSTSDFTSRIIEYSSGELTCDKAWKVGGTTTLLSTLSVHGSASVQSLNVNGGSLTYDSTNKSWKLNGNLLVTGGIAMYSDGSDIGGGGTGGGGSIDYPLKWSGFSSGSYDGSSTQTIYIPSKLSELTNDSGYALSSVLSDYLPLSGGTVNGDLVVRNSYGGIALVHTEKGNKGILFYKGGSDWRVTNHNWAAEYTLYHSGNFTPFNYLLKSGGTLNGGLSIATSGWGSQLSIIETSSQASLIRFYTTNTDAQENFLGGIGFSTEKKPFVNIPSVASYIIWHEGNFNPSDYLPKSGGTLTNSLAVSSGTISSTRTSTRRAVFYKNASASIDSGTYIVDVSDNGDAILKLTWDDLTWKGNTIIHSGNIGSQSVANADTLDGAHASTFAYKDASNAYAHNNGTSTERYILIAQCTTTSPSTYQHRQCVISYGNRNGTGLISIFINSSDSYNKNTFDIQLTGNLNSSYVYGTKTDDGSKCTFSVYVFMGNYNTQTYNILSTQGGFTFPNTYTSTKPTNIASITHGVATKLATARTIWGQSFDGSSGIDGDFTMANTKSIQGKDSSNVARTLLTFSSNNDLFIGRGSSGAGYATKLCGYSIQLCTNSDQTERVRISSSGNVGIGTTSPLYKLHVDGTMYGDLKMKTPRTIWGQSFDGTGNISGTIIGCLVIRDAGGQWIVGKGGEDYSRVSLGSKALNQVVEVNNSEGNITLNSSGNVGIGTTAPAYKLDVNGTLCVSGATTFSSNLSVSGQLSIGADFVMPNAKGFYIKDSAGSSKRVILLNTLNHFTIAYDTAAAGYDTYLDGNNIYLRYGTSHTTGITLASDGQVTIAKYTTIKSGLSANSLELSMATPYIDFHFNSSTADYTSRIIEYSSGALTCTGQWKVDGALTAKSTLSVNSTSTFTGKTTHNGGIGATSGSFSGQITSTVAEKTAPFIVASTTKVNNLNADLLDGVHLSSIYTVDSSADFSGTTSAPQSMIVRYSNTSSTSNHPYSILGGNQCIALNLHCGNDYMGQLALGFSNNYLAIRHKHGTTTWGSWGKIHSGYSDTTGKLHNKVKIWGQNFDGSGNITADLDAYVNVIRDVNGNYNFASDGNGNLQVGTTAVAHVISLSTAGASKGFHMLNNGDIGIGTTTPSYKLDVNGTLGVSGTIYFGANHYIRKDTSGVFIYNVSAKNYIELYDNTNIVLNGGNVGIGTANPSSKLHVAGNILTSGSITMNSMRSMKNIINENGLSLEELSTIKPTRFTWKDGRDNRIHVGGIADDVMKVLPEVVFKGNDGVLSMDYASAAFVMAASLIQPMTEHERRIANLERENALLKEEIRNLKSA